MTSYKLGRLNHERKFHAYQQIVYYSRPLRDNCFQFNFHFSSGTDNRNLYVNVMRKQHRLK